MSTRTAIQHYPPSLIDRLTEWVAERMQAEWAFYAGLGIALVGLQIFFLWLDEGLHFDTLFPVIAYNGLAIAFVLALIQYLDAQAVAALEAMGRALTLDTREAQALGYRIATMPSSPALLAGLGTVALLVATELGGSVPLRYAVLDALPLFTVVYQILDKVGAFCTGVLIYHTVRQLGWVHTTLSSHTQIDLFNPKPLYAFSKLTGSTAIALILAVYGWMLLNPELLASPMGLGGTLALTLLALLVFVWPLLGAHRLMEREKERTLHEVDHLFQSNFASFNQKLQDQDFPALERLNPILASLEIQQTKIKALPTWPWRMETVRSVLAAVVLPLVVRLLQFLADQALPR